MKTWLNDNYNGFKSGELEFYSRFKELKEMVVEAILSQMEFECMPNVKVVILSINPLSFDNTLKCLPCDEISTPDFMVMSNLIKNITDNFCSNYANNAITDEGVFTQKGDSWFFEKDGYEKLKMILEEKGFSNE